MKLDILKRALILAILLSMPMLAEAATSAGEIARITGDSIADARALDGSVRKLNAGDRVFSGDTISTGKDTTLDVLFADGSRFVIGPKTELVVDKYVYGQGPEHDAFHSRIAKGVFRFVSGLLAKSKSRDNINVRLNVVATIGIRGTYFEGEVLERHEQDGVGVDASAKVVLLEPEEEGKKTAIVVSNEFGSVVIDQPGYGTEIPDEKSPPSPVRRMQLHTIENMLRTLRSTVRQSGTAIPKMR